MSGKRPQCMAGLAGERERIRVLVACRSACLRDAVGQLFQGEGAFELVGSTGDGQEAVQLAKDLTADLVLMDLNMPRMGGLEATRSIKAHQDAPVVILCALDDSEQVRAAAKAAGADAFVPKAPRMTANLQAEIRRAFAGLGLEC